MIGHILIRCGTWKYSSVGEGQPEESHCDNQQERIEQVTVSNGFLLLLRELPKRDQNRLVKRFLALSGVRLSSERFSNIWCMWLITSRYCRLEIIY